MTLTPEQQAFIEKCRTAAHRAIQWSHDADELHMPLLAGEWARIAHGLSVAVESQERAFKDGTLAPLDFQSSAEEGV
jgi:hypothetical protein